MFVAELFGVSEATSGFISPIRLCTAATTASEAVRRLWLKAGLDRITKSENSSKKPVLKAQVTLRIIDVGGHAGAYRCLTGFSDGEASGDNQTSVSSEELVTLPDVC